MRLWVKYCGGVQVLWGARYLRVGKRRILKSLLGGWMTVVGSGSSIRLKLEVLLCGSVIDNGWLVWGLLRKVWLLVVGLCQRCCWQRLWRRLLLKKVILWWGQSRWKCGAQRYRFCCVVGMES